MGDFSKNFITTIVITILMSLCSVFWGFIKDTEWGFAVFLANIVIVWIGFWIFSKKSKKESIEDYICYNPNDMRYNIVFIDDEPKYRSRYGLYSSIYSIQVTDKMDSVRFLYGFDIVIIDVVKIVSFNQESSLQIMQSLKNLKPYKYIIAISEDASKLNECGLYVDAAIVKTPSFDKDLEAAIKTAFSILDNPAEYWKTLLAKKKLSLSEETLAQYEEDYINTLKQNPYFKKKN